MTVAVYKGLTRNLEIGNTSVLSLTNICRVGQVTDAKFGMIVPNEKLHYAAKSQGYSFYHFWKPTGGMMAGG